MRSAGSSPSKIVLFNRSFHPDTEALGVVLTDLARSLAREFPLTVVCGVPYGYPRPTWQLVSREVFDNVRVERVLHTTFHKSDAIGRVANWLSYTAMATAVGLLQRSRVAIVATDPPLLSALAVALKRVHGCRLVLICQDLYADVALHVGIVKHGVLYAGLDALVRRAFAEADLIVVPSKDMALRVTSKGADPERVIVIPNWVDVTSIKPVARSENSFIRELGLERCFTLMYAGNMGVAQDFDALLDGLAQLSVDAPRWKLVLVGEGVRRKYIERRVADLRIDVNTVFLKPQPRARLSALLSSASLHVVPLRKGLVGCVAPSKVYGIMSAARPYLAISDRGCEMAMLAVAGGFGLWAPGGDSNAVTRCVEWAMNHPAELELMGQRARSVAVSDYSSTAVLDRWQVALRAIYHAN